MPRQEVLPLGVDVFNDDHRADRVDDVLTVWMHVESVRHRTYMLNNSEQLKQGWLIGSVMQYVF